MVLQRPQLSSMDKLHRDNDHNLGTLFDHKALEVHSHDAEVLQSYVVRVLSKLLCTLHLLLSLTKLEIQEKGVWPGPHQKICFIHHSLPAYTALHEAHWRCPRAHMLICKAVAVIHRDTGTTEKF